MNATATDRAAPRVFIREPLAGPGLIAAPCPIRASSPDRRPGPARDFARGVMRAVLLLLLLTGAALAGPDNGDHDDPRPQSVTPGLPAVRLVLGSLLLGGLAGWLLALRTAMLSQRRDVAVLRHVAERGESYGRVLIEAGLGNQGSIYARLRRLVQEGYLCVREVPRGNERGPRYLYRLTPAGVAELAALDALALAHKERA